MTENEAAVTPQLQVEFGKRLLAGATIMGDLWRKRNRCSEGWSIGLDNGEPRPCSCDPQRGFCQGKAKWASLAFIVQRKLIAAEYGFAVSMSAKEWDATGMTINVELGIGVTVAIGPKGNLSMTELAHLAKDPEGAKRILGILRSFPGSRIQVAVDGGDPNDPKTDFKPVE